MAIRMRELRYSVPATLNHGLQRGLPIAAILAATVPVWGMSWYFDTENWAAGMWNSWAESRTDTWREAMVRAVLAPEGGSAGPRALRVQPPGIGSGDFSFVVIGDTGEGDASQHVLRDQLLRWRTALTSASSSSRPTSSIPPARCATTRRSSGCRSRE